MEESLGERMQETAEVFKRSTWKKLALISLSAGAGFAMVAAVILGIFIWYDSRPKPDKPWNTSAIVAESAPSFDASTNSSRIRLEYYLVNKTDRDYQLSSAGSFKLLAKQKSGSLSTPIPSEEVSVTLPVFVPAHQKAVLDVIFEKLPEPYSVIGSNSEAQEHEHLRAYIESNFGGIEGFVIFDDLDRYEIVLPRWLSELPKKN
jgi:hypothetical protein